MQSICRRPMTAVQRYEADAPRIQIVRVFLEVHDEPNLGVGGTRSGSATPIVHVINDVSVSMIFYVPKARCRPLLYCP